MTNFEKYKEELLTMIENGSLYDFIETHVSNGTLLGDCRRDIFEAMKWAAQKYIEPPVDWTTVPVDTKILVSIDGVNWYKRHFDKSLGEYIMAWDNGKTSHTGDKTIEWNHAKLYMEDKK